MSWFRSKKSESKEEAVVPSQNERKAGTANELYKDMYLKHIDQECQDFCVNGYFTMWSVLAMNGLVCFMAKDGGALSGSSRPSLKHRSS